MALVVVGGLPGTGKTLIARHAARLARGLLVSKDVIEAALWRSGVRREDGSGWIAYDVITAIADAATHRARLGRRRRGIPGWYELAWGDVEEAAGRYEPWTVEHLVLDAMRPLDDNVAALGAYLERYIPR